MNTVKLERIRTKAKKLLEETERGVATVEKVAEPIADKLALSLCLSDHTGRWMVGVLAAVYVAGDYFGVPTLAQAISFLKAGLL